jgi:hypothetical protein
MIFNYLLIKLGNTFKKEKNKLGIFLYLISLYYKKGFLAFYWAINLPKIKEMFFNHIITYTGPLDPHVSVGC